MVFYDSTTTQNKIYANLLSVGAASLSLVPSLLLPVSTPQAVAHSSGWGCCCGSGGHVGPLLLLLSQCIICAIECGGRGWAVAWGGMEKLAAEGG
jgi:hypothetical protein